MGKLGAIGKNKKSLSLILGLTLLLTSCHAKIAERPLYKRDLGVKSGESDSKMLPLNGLPGNQTDRPKTTVTAPKPSTADDKGTKKETAPLKQAGSPSATLTPQGKIRQALGREAENKFDRDAALKNISSLQNVPVFKQKVLRLALVDAADYHPFVERDEYDQVITRLLFRSLFRIDKYKRLTKDLVKSYRYSNDMKVLEITLDEQAMYADKTPIDAYDVIKAFNLLAIPKNDNFESKLAQVSPYYQTLQSVDKVEQIGAYGLRFYLKKPDLFLAYALTFPIVKSNELYNKGLNNFTASGAYSLSHYRQTDSETAAEIKQLKEAYAFAKQRPLGERPKYFNSLIQRFAVFDYPSEDAAVSAFLAKNIDLCYTWPAYTDELKAREHYVFHSEAAVNLTFNRPQIADAAGSQEQQEKLADYYADVQLLKSKLSSFYNDKFLFREVDPALSPAAYNFTDELFRPYKLIPAYPLNRLIRERKNLAGDFKQKKWQIIIPENLSFGADIISRLQQKFTEIGLKAEFTSVALSNFQTAVKQKPWDIAIYPLLTHRIPDIGYELKELSNGRFWRRNYTQAFLPEFYLYPKQAQSIIDDLEEIKLTDSMLSPLENVTYQQKFSELYQYTNNMPLLKYNRALYLQDSLRGELAPFALNPLAGVEDLWIWSTP